MGRTNAQAQSGGSGHNYSTTEQVVGTWIDGKPLYEKTKVFENVSGQRISMDLDIANVDFISIVPEASLISDNRPLPYVTGTDAANNAGGFFEISQSTVIFAWRSGYGTTGPFNVTLTVQYTKTTDTV